MTKYLFSSFLALKSIWNKLEKFIIVVFVVFLTLKLKIKKNAFLKILVLRQYFLCGKLTLIDCSSGAGSPLARVSGGRCCCTCRWSSDWLQSNVKRVPIGWLYVQMKLWLVAINVKRVPIGWHFWCMSGVVVREDEAPIGCNQMLNVFLLAGYTCIWSSDWLQSNVKRVPIGWLYMQMKLWLVAIKC